MNKKSRKILGSSGLALLSIIALIAAGCGKKEEKPRVRVAFFPNITHSQAMIMKEKAMLEEALGDQYQVSYLTFNAGPAEVEALLAGEVDLGYIGPVPAINASVKSEGDVQIISNAADAGAVLVRRKGEEINSVADLDGKTVAIPQFGNTQHLCLLDLLRSNGLSPKTEGGTVNVVAVSNADVQGLMDRGEIDAALPPEPWGSILEENVGADIVLDEKQVFMDGQYPTAVVVARKDFLDQHPDAAKAFLKAHQEATRFVNDNREEAAGIVNGQIEAITGKSFDQDILNQSFSRLIITDTLSKKSVDAFITVGVEQGFISEAPGQDLYALEIGGEHGSNN